MHQQTCAMITHSDWRSGYLIMYFQLIAIRIYGKAHSFNNNNTVMLFSSSIKLSAFYVTELT